ncbi:MAG: ABC transporter ATP-binding protein/permease [Oscillospiraceae bacterium]|nr:ABC transporter ATP-binding protein/permease [Oscillospiraceae bacterium]
MTDNSFYKLIKSQSALLRPFWYLAVIIFLLAIAMTVLSVAFAIINQEIVDNVFVSLNLNYLLDLLPIIIGLFILTMVVETSSSYLHAKLRALHSIAAQKDFYSKILKANYHFVSSVMPNDIYYRMFVDTSVITSFAYSMLLINPISIMTTTILLVVIFMWSWQLALFITVCMIFQLFLAQIFKKPLKYATERYRIDEQNVATSVEESFRIIDIIKAFFAESWQKKRVEQKLEFLFNSKLKTQFFNILFTSLTTIIHTFWSLGALIFGAWLATRNIISIGAYIGIYSVASRIYAPLNQLIGQTLAYQQVKVSQERMLEYTGKIDERYNSGKIPFLLKNGIVVKDLSFSYADRSIFTKSNFEFKCGKLYVISGKSGQGKTTLIKLLAGLFFPNEGKIFIDNIDTTDIQYLDFRNSIAYMPQQSVIFEASLRENVAFGNEYSDDKIFECLVSVGMAEYVNSLEKGLDTLIGLKNRNMSDGEKQRICLARVLIRTPKVVLLDEPTSHLDEKSSRIIFESLHNYKKQQRPIIIMVSHNAIDEHVDEWIKM